MKIPGNELIALRRVASAADELIDAIYACDETRIPGCNFEIQFAELQGALSALPRYYERGRYIWKEIEEDYRQDAPGG
ncbi:MAG: hypothetical protein ACE5M4_02675 [Anaerolineales bacterium]